MQHLGCFKEKVNRYELQPELMTGELLELSNSMTVDQCANGWELAFDRLDPNTFIRFKRRLFIRTKTQPAQDRKTT